MTRTPSHDELFKIFVLQQQQWAMVALGKMVHPLTGQNERDLESARFAIDLLGMMVEKTKGNLSTDEDRLITQVLTNLRLNFVEEAAKPPSATESGESAAAAPAEKAGEA